MAIINDSVKILYHGVVLFVLDKLFLLFKDLYFVWLLCLYSQYCDGNYLLQVVLIHPMNQYGLRRKRNLGQGVWFICIRENTGIVKSVRIGRCARISTRPHQKHHLTVKLVKTGCSDSTFCDMMGLQLIANLSRCRVHHRQAGTACQHRNGLVFVYCRVCYSIAVKDWEDSLVMVLMFFSFAFSSSFIWGSDKHLDSFPALSVFITVTWCVSGL